ncbi:hypothetical protein D3C73_1586800 [compost metagenome]
MVTRLLPATVPGVRVRKLPEMLAPAMSADCTAAVNVRLSPSASSNYWLRS